MKEKNINLCTSFGTIGRSMGREPQYSYSANGYLGANGYFGAKAVLKVPLTNVFSIILKKS